jgi:hypothetical protein
VWVSLVRSVKNRAVGTSSCWWDFDYRYANRKTWISAVNESRIIAVHRRVWTPQGKERPEHKTGIKLSQTIKSNCGQTVYTAVNEVLLYQQTIMWLGVFPKQLQQATVNLVTSARPPARPYRKTLTGWIFSEISYLGIITKVYRF